MKKLIFITLMAVITLTACDSESVTKRIKSAWLDSTSNDSTFIVIDSTNTDTTCTCVDSVEVK